MKVLSKYHGIFWHLENHRVLDVDNNEQMYALHMVYLPRLNKDLKEWRTVWNNHPIRTEKNQSPLQLWHADRIVNRNSTCTSIRNNLDTTPNERAEQVREFRAGNQLSEPDDIGIVITRIPQPLPTPLMNELEAAIDDRRSSDSNAIDIYGEVMTFIKFCNRNLPNYNINVV